MISLVPRQLLFPWCGRNIENVLIENVLIEKVLNDIGVLALRQLAISAAMGTGPTEREVETQLDIEPVEFHTILVERVATKQFRNTFANNRGL